MTESLESVEVGADAVRARYRRERMARWAHVQATVKTLSADELRRLQGDLVALATRDAVEEGYNG